jgi:hypothetical protein
MMTKPSVNQMVDSMYALARHGFDSTGTRIGEPERQFFELEKFEIHAQCGSLSQSGPDGAPAPVKNMSLNPERLQANHIAGPPA